MGRLQDVSAAIAAAIPTETAIFTSNAEPPSPDACMTLYGPFGPAEPQDLSGNVEGGYMVQARLRDPSQQALQSRMEALYLAFRSLRRYPAAIITLRAAGQPLYQYPRDANNRSIASLNIRVIEGS